MYGYMGKILRIDLTRQRVIEEDLKEDLIKGFVGGRGFGAKILWDELKPGVDPLSPDNKLIITTGPLTGTPAHSCSRWMITTKSPLTGGYFRTTGGGFFAAELKFSGYDFIVIEGRAEKPVYVWIDDGKFEVRDASHIWGVVTSESEKLIREETDPRARVLCIGPAGEKLVRFACVVSDRRTAGRGGAGAVMGSKNLKAIAVRGTKEVVLADSDAFKELVKEQLENYRRSPFFKGFQALGTNSVVYAFYELGHFPTYNFKQLPLDGAWRFSDTELSKYIVKHYGCYNCVIACGKIFKAVKGPYAGTAWDLPEYETHWSLGGQCGNINIESIIYANKLCDEYGIDTISTGVMIGYAMELYEKGIISKYDTGGLDLRWGDPDVIVELVRKIALRDGFGNILAEGVKRASEIIGRGSERYAMHVKGLEMPAYDPRAAKAHGLNYATAPCGANHCMGWSKHEILGIPEKVDPLSVEGKGKIAVYNQDETAFFETGIMCLFPTAIPMIPHDLYARMLYAATGIEEFRDVKYLWLVGERISNIERAFNVREGFTRKDDTLPERILKEPFPRTPAKGQVFELDQLLDQYYEARGWDKETGIPTEAKLKELGLKYVAEELKRLGKLEK